MQLRARARSYSVLRHVSNSVQRDLSDVFLVSMYLFKAPMREGGYSCGLVTPDAIFILLSSV